MQYVSTRGTAPVLSFADAVLAGLATDGGLYVPQQWPSAPDTLTTDYASLAASVMAPFIGDEIDANTLQKLCGIAYSTFRDPRVTPLVPLEANHWMLELFHGPTLAFKDVALQFLGQLFDLLLEQRDEYITIVGATSGDTGSAAIDGVKNCSRVKIVILYPEGRVSDVQRRQMTTVNSPNVKTLAVNGTFDDCQDLVKAMFNNQKFREQQRLSAVNSINWARIMAQVVYYFSAAQQLASSGVSISNGVSFSVPTGNFGNVLSGWIARQMGAPIHQLIVGSNSNDILTRFFATQEMRAQSVLPTLSPSMDIQVSSNFERLLFEMNNRDGARTADQLGRFRSEGVFAVSPEQYNTWLAPVFRAARCDDATTLEVIRDVFEKTGQLIDPHTAVGVFGARQHQSADIPMVTLATAHAAKFPDAVEKATGSRPSLPAHLADLFDHEEYVTAVENDLEAVQNAVARFTAGA
jgi:threonine synthase